MVGYAIVEGHDELLALVLGSHDLGTSAHSTKGRVADAKSLFGGAKLGRYRLELHDGVLQILDLLGSVCYA